MKRMIRSSEEDGYSFSRGYMDHGAEYRKYVLILNDVYLYLSKKIDEYIDENNINAYSFVNKDINSWKIDEYGYEIKLRVLLRFKDDSSEDFEIVLNDGEDFDIEKLESPDEMYRVFKIFTDEIERRLGI